jgi:hypothetical protein
MATEDARPHVLVINDTPKSDATTDLNPRDDRDEGPRSRGAPSPTLEGDCRVGAPLPPYGGTALHRQKGGHDHE